MSQKINFAVLEEIYNNVVPHWSAVLICCNHSITRLISFTKNGSNQRSILSVYGPRSKRLDPRRLTDLKQVEILRSKNRRTNQMKFGLKWNTCTLPHLFKYKKDNGV